MRPGKAAGIDGIPSYVLRNLLAFSIIMTLLSTVLLKYGVYPLAWGTALVRAFLKPGKPNHETTSLGGIRLVYSTASWFGRIMYSHARVAW